jgi:hypothetical protein
LSFLLCHCPHEPFCLLAFCLCCHYLALWSLLFIFHLRCKLCFFGCFLRLHFSFHQIKELSFRIFVFVSFCVVSIKVSSPFCVCVYYNSSLAPFVLVFISIACTCVWVLISIVL